MVDEQDPGDEAATGEAAARPEVAPLTGIVLDSGALDDLLDEEVRADLIAAARAEEIQLVVPLVVVTEFLLGHPKDQVRADRVLGLVDQIEATTQIARRAAWLLGRAGRALTQKPSVADGMVAAFGEIHGAVATHDAADLRALAAAGDGFDVYSVREVLDVMGRPRR